MEQTSDRSNPIHLLLVGLIHREAHLITIGGGATSDFGGFVASCLLRGISWSVVPTTLLSMVDACIGGKVAINSKFGKNLIGNFYKPSNIFIIQDFLKTLPESEMISGFGEVIKYCFLDKDIFEKVQQEDVNKIDIIKMCASYKNELVEKDFNEKNLRQILNLGHTFGHAIEVIYRIPHGEAVMWGMFVIFKLFNEDQFIDALKFFRLKLEIVEDKPPWLHKTFPGDKMMELIAKDKKKKKSDEINLVRIRKIGDPFIDNIRFDKLLELIKQKEYEFKTSTL